MKLVATPYGQALVDAPDTRPVPTLAELKADAQSRLASRRWQAETGGITVGGIFVPTDRETQGIVDRIVRAFADGDMTGSVNFKAPDGWVQIDEATARAIKAAGAQHIQACFDRESELSALIEAADDADALAAIDLDSGWPT